MLHIGNRSREHLINLSAIHGANLTIDHTTQTNFLDRPQRCARTGDVCNSRDTATHGLKGTKQSGIVPILGAEELLLIFKMHLPGGIGNILDQSTHCRVFKMSMGIDESGHNRRQAEVYRFLIRITRLKLCCIADILDAPIADKHRAILDMRMVYRQYVSGNQ